MKKITTIVLALIVTVLTGCASTHGNPNVYTRNQAMAPGRVIQGMIIQVRPVVIASSGIAQAGGAAAGAGVGALLTRNTSGTVRAVAMIGGAALGLLGGNNVGTKEAEEIVVRLTDASSRVIVQEPGATPRRPGEKVFLLINGTQARIVESY